MDGTRNDFSELRENGLKLFFGDFSEESFGEKIGLVGLFGVKFSELGNSIRFFLSPIDIDFFSAIERVGILESFICVFGFKIFLETNESERFGALSLESHDHGGNGSISGAVSSKNFFNFFNRFAGHVFKIKIFSRVNSISFSLERANFNGSIFNFDVGGFL